MNTILICEDDEGISGILRLVLEEKGYNIMLIVQEKEFWQYVTHTPPQLILMDLSLPTMDTKKIVRKIKAEGKCTVPIIIVSANQHVKTIAKEIGADDVLEKPFGLNELEEKIRHYFN